MYKVVGEDKNKTKINIWKRISALVLAILLALLYAVTLVFAITDNPQTMSFFKASVTLTIIIPVLIYAYQLVFRVIRLMGENKTDNGRDN